jgi:CRISPR/Cas system CMR-associated protein Cmr5 small subunit
MRVLKEEFSDGKIPSAYNGYISSFGASIIQSGFCATLALFENQLPSIESQAILGFDFDYTSGLPIIRGSSIKRVLRSAFKYLDYIKELLHNKIINIKKLKIEIFENNDIFFDVTIINITYQNFF